MKKKITELGEENKMLKCRLQERINCIETQETAHNRRISEIQKVYQEKLNDIEKFGSTLNKVEAAAFAEFNKSLRDARQREESIINKIRHDTEAHCGRMEAMVASLSTLSEFMEAIKSSLQSVEPNLKSLRESLGGDQTRADGPPPPGRQTRRRNRETTIFINPANPTTRGDFMELLQDIISTSTTPIRVQKVISTKTGNYIVIVPDEEDAIFLQDLINSK